jgi:hypothetical protein
VSTVYEGRQIVGLDLHRRRSVLVRMSEAGEVLETTRISNDPEYLRQVMERAGEHPEVVLEACYGWVLGCGYPRRVGRVGTSGAPTGGESVRVPAGQERRTRRERSS